MNMQILKIETQCIWMKLSGWIKFRIRFIFFFSVFCDTAIS